MGGGYGLGGEGRGEGWMKSCDAHTRPGFVTHDALYSWKTACTPWRWSSLRSVKSLAGESFSVSTGRCEKYPTYETHV